MSTKGTISLVVDPNDSLYWDAQMDFLRRKGWEIEMYKHPSYFQPDAASPLPVGASEADVVMVYALGAHDWWIEALTALNKPTVYITSIGVPNLHIDKLVVLNSLLTYEELLAAVEKVAA